MLPGRFPPRLIRGASVPPLANVSCTPHRAPADLPADLAFGGSGHANTSNSRPTYSASERDLRGHGVRLMKRRWRHGLRRRYDGQGKDSNCDQPDHGFLPCLVSRTNHALSQSAHFDSDQPCSGSLLLQKIPHAVVMRLIFTRLIYRNPACAKNALGV